MVPVLLSSLPSDQKEQLSDINVAGVPNDKQVVSEQKIISFQQGVNTKLDRYLICSIDDDPDGTNAYGIYDPTDLAVTVRNLIRLDVKHLFLGTHIHWPDLPAVENNTLASQLKLLDSCILSTPLSRSAEADELPKYLRDSSLPKEAAKEIAHLLPIVNGLSLAPTLDIPDNCVVGFSQLESEPDSLNIPLLAIWDDRIILSSLLLERMHQLSVSLDSVEIITGFIKLGDSGSMIPINEFGYFKPIQSIESVDADIISAEITSIEESPVDTHIAILTASGVQTDNYRAIERPLEQLSQLALTPVMLDRVDYLRIPWWSELIIVVFIGVLLALFAGSSLIVFFISTVVIGIGIYFGSLNLHGLTHYFIPILYILIALLVSFIARIFLKGNKLQSDVEKKDKKEEVKEVVVHKPSSNSKMMTLAEKRREGEPNKPIERGEPKEEVPQEVEVPDEIKMLIEEIEYLSDAEETEIYDEDDQAKVEEIKEEFKEEDAKEAEEAKMEKPQKEENDLQTDYHSFDDLEEDFVGDFCDLEEPSQQSVNSKEEEK